MLKLKADFEADWIAHLRADLANTWGAEIACIPNGDIAAYFFESLHRRLPPRSRTLKIADDFRCPPAHMPGWQTLQDKVREGKDLKPYLSIRHASLFNRDGLLTEWGVHHFHLAAMPDRTDALVFALTDDRTFCAINVFSHGDWEEIRIIESIHRNWPDMISMYRMKQVTGNHLSQLQRRDIRKHNVNVLTSTVDGTVYGPIGGSVSCAGLKMDSMDRANMWLYEIQGLHARVEKTLPELMHVLKQNGYAGESEIEGRLRITDAGYQIFYPQFRILATLVYAHRAELLEQSNIN